MPLPTKKKAAKTSLYGRPAGGREKAVKIELCLVTHHESSFRPKITFFDEEIWKFFSLRGATFRWTRHLRLRTRHEMRNIFNNVA